MSATKTAKQLREERAGLVHQMRELTDKASAEDRALNGEERAKFDKLHADQEALKVRFTELEMIQSLVSESDEPINRNTPLPGRGDVDHRASGNPKTQDSPRVTMGDYEDAMRAWFMGGPRNRSQIADRQREASQRVGLDPLNPSIRFSLAKRAPRSASEVDRLQTVAGTSYQSVGTAGLGGNTVPNEPMRPLEQALLAFGGMRQTSTVLRTATGATLPIPTANGTDEKGAVLAENTSGAIEDLGFGQITLTSYKYTSKMVRASLEFLQDTSIPFLDYVGNQLGTRIGRITNQHFTVGTTSTSNPFGIVVEASTGVVTATSTGFSFTDIINLMHSVDPAYRDMPGAGWMFNDATFALIKQKTDGQGRPLWMPGYTQGAPDLILGKPYTINQDMPTVSTTTSSAPATVRRCILFGDLSKYLIRDVMDIELVRLDERYAELAQVAFVAFSRHDGRLLDAGTKPVKYLRVSS